MSAPPGRAAERPHKSLKAFRRITLVPGQSERVALQIALDDLRWRDPAAHDWQLERGTYRVMAGGASDRLIECAAQV